MPPLFRNPPLIQNYYIVGVSDSAEPVCNYNYRAVLVKFFLESYNFEKSIQENCAFMLLQGITGKGAPEFWVAVAKPGKVMFEIAGVPEETAREAMRLAAHKLPCKCKFVKREEGVGEN